MEDNLTPQQKKVVDRHAHTIVVYRRSVRKFIHDMWGLDPQPVKPEYQKEWDDVCRATHENWEAKKKTVKPEWFGDLLPNTGKDSIRIGTPENKTKTIDAIVKNDYISFKYLKESGGAQANQISSVKTDLKIVKESIKNGTFRHTYIVILSGKYGVSKIPELRDKFQCPGIHICTCEDYCNI